MTTQEMIDRLRDEAYLDWTDFGNFLNDVADNMENLLTNKRWLREQLDKLEAEENSRSWGVYR